MPRQSGFQSILNRAKWSFTTRNVPRDLARNILLPVNTARAGDLLVARIERIGSHRRLQTRERRYSSFFPGDIIVAACGARFATDQFEGLARIGSDGAAHLLAGGGVVGEAISRKGGLKPATTVTVVGLLTDNEGRVINLADHTISQSPSLRPDIVLGVVGSSMNAGKTDTAAWLIHGLESAGHRTAGIKMTGTGSFGDLNAYEDAGATRILDFTDVGMASTYREPLERISTGLDTLLAAATQSECSVAVVELADGVTQVETAAFLARPDLTAKFDGILMAAGDPLSALGGTNWLVERGIRPLALSGLLTKAPLVVEELRAQTDIPVLSREELADPAVASTVLVRAGNSSIACVA